MKAKDRIMMLSIINSINSKDFGKLNSSQKEWLVVNSDFRDKFIKQKKFYSYLNQVRFGQGTIDELIFGLDLSDRMYR